MICSFLISYDAFFSYEWEWCTAKEEQEEREEGEEGEEREESQVCQLPNHSSDFVEEEEEEKEEEEEEEGRKMGCCGEGCEERERDESAGQSSKSKKVFALGEDLLFGISL